VGDFTGKLFIRDLLDLAIKDKVIFVPGDPFYVNRRNTNTLRLNFSCMEEETIRSGIKNLGKAMTQLLKAVILMEGLLY